MIPLCLFSLYITVCIDVCIDKLYRACQLSVSSQDGTFHVNRPSPKFVSAAHSSSSTGGAVAPMTGTIVKVSCCLFRRGLVQIIETVLRSIEYFYYKELHK